jgi:hypothetical protein
MSSLTPSPSTLICGPSCKLFILPPLSFALSPQSVSILTSSGLLSLTPSLEIISFVSFLQLKLRTESRVEVGERGLFFTAKGEDGWERV